MKRKEKRKKLFTSQDEVDEKIALLSEYLPEFMVKHRKSLYGVISKGIHELSKEENLKNFRIVKDAIDIILKEKLTYYQEKKLREKTERLLPRIKNKNQ